MVYVADSLNASIYTITDGKVDVFASGFVGKSNPPVIGPGDLEFDDNGNLFVADGKFLWKISPLITEDETSDGVPSIEEIEDETSDETPLPIEEIEEDETSNETPVEEVEDNDTISQTITNCQGCCSYHGGVICNNGVTMCADGTPLSETCVNKGCNACGVKNIPIEEDSESKAGGCFITNTNHI